MKETPSYSIYTEMSCWNATNDLCKPSYWSIFNCKWTTPHERLVNSAHAGQYSITQEECRQKWNPKNTGLIQGI